MQVDFHFYAIYALARLSGRGPREAKTIAYASQHTDDAVDGRDLVFDDGTRFNRVLTAHKAIHWGVLTERVQKEVFVPFHFVPGFDPDAEIERESRENFLTRPDSPLSRAALEEALAMDEEEPGRLERIGIALHAHADTFSHQGFSGLTGTENDAAAVSESMPERTKASRLASRLWRGLVELALPPIGHGEVFHLPDEPFRTWSYESVRTETEHSGIDNTARSLLAARSIFEALGGEGWERHEEAFRRLFEFAGNVEDREASWRRAFADPTNRFQIADFGEADRAVRYDEHEWPDEAFEPAGDRRKKPTRRPGFDNSHWARFHAAARLHRKVITDAVARAELAISRSWLLIFWNSLWFVVARVLHLAGRKSLSAKALKRGAFRFAVYGSLMTFGEIFFYTFTKVGRELPLVGFLFDYGWHVDPRLDLEAMWSAPVKVLYGQASLWMFLVYASIAIFGLEPAHRRIKEWKWYSRGLVYMSIILFMEWVAGWLLRYYVGYDIWYYTDPLGRYLIYTSLAIAPMWFALGLVSENFTNFVLKYTDKKKRLRMLGVFDV